MLEVDHEREPMPEGQQTTSALPSADVLEKWTTCVRTRTGALVCIRPLRSDDRAREIAFLNSLSEQSRYFRLFTPLKFLPPHLVDQLMDVDYQGRMAFVATIQRDGSEEFVGVARYAAADQPATVELGITVTDAWHRHGIARLLLDHLMRFARWRGIRHIVGLVLPENQPMIALAARAGFHHAFDTAQHLVVISRDLSDVAAEVSSDASVSAAASPHS